MTTAFNRQPSSGTQSFPQVDDFIQRVRAPVTGAFDPTQPILVSRAPARLDVMGGIADYTGSLVLEMPLDRAVVMAIQPRTDQHVVIRSLLWEQRPGETAEVRWPLARLYHDPDRLCSAFALAFDRQGTSWAKYVAGIFFVLLEADLVPHFGGGATIVFDSTATPSAGVGSSAAVEVAAYQAIAGLFDIHLDPLEAAQLCQRAENVVVGAPCGIMDQVTSLLGEPHALLQISCQPHDVLGSLPLPEGVTVVGIHSGVKHHISGDRYIDARVAAFMGHRIILDILRREDEPEDPSHRYLANFDQQEYVERFRDRLPTKMSGEEFLGRYGESLDSVTAVNPQTIYKVRSRTEHHIYESRRTQQFAGHLARARRSASLEPLIEAGLLMYASHWSYGQRCGLGCVETETLMNLVRERGPQHGFYGAKISGGGAGGTVVVLMNDRPESHDALGEIMHAYQKRTGRIPEVFRGTSPGSLAFGTRTIS